MPHTPFDFTRSLDRLRWSATKWEKYRGRDVIPLWIADMDFVSPPAVQRAVADFASHGNFGYMAPPKSLAQQLADHYLRQYDWTIDPDWVVWLGNLVSGLNLSVRAQSRPGSGVVCFSPVYPPFLHAPGAQDRSLIEVPLVAETDHKTPNRLRYTIDFPKLHAALDQSIAPAELLMLCHPHNPTGRQWTDAELDAVVDLAVARNINLCSDEVHGGLVLPNAPERHRHEPLARRLASRHPDWLARTITLDSPGKVFNLAGLNIAWAIIPDAGLRRRWQHSSQRLTSMPSAAGYVALEAALAEGEAWRLALLDVLGKHRDRVSQVLSELSVPHTYPSATYLSWFDARVLAERAGGIDRIATYLEHAGVGISDGRDFGGPSANAAGHLRLNFACPPDLLDQALDRLQVAFSG